MYMIFVTLPVRDLARARAFYEALGFRYNQYSSDERTATLGVDENIVVRLLTATLSWSWSPARWATRFREQLRSTALVSEVGRRSTTWSPRRRRPAGRPGSPPKRSRRSTPAASPIPTVTSGS